MAAKPIRTGQQRGNIFTATITRLMKTRRSRPNRRPASSKLPLLARLAVREAAKMPDPVSLVVFAIDRVGPAAVRACASGVEVRIAAADEATAAVIRAALTETAQRRPTDRLIQVVID